MTKATLLDHFSALKDPRQSCKVMYPLPEILLVVLCGTMAGAEDFADIERWAKRKLDFLRRFLTFERGIPSHDTLNDVMNALPADLFSECFISWVSALREGAPDIVAIDGKTSRRARARLEERRFTRSPPGLRASVWCWVRRSSTRKATRSSPFRACSNGSNSRAPL